MRTLTVGAIVADRSSDELRTVFVAFVGGLENDTLYAVSVKAADSQGRANRRSSTFRTLRPQTIADGSGIGDLAAGAGCAAQCIRTAQMEAGLRAAKMTVNTNVPARLMITAARAEPLQTSLGPSFAHPEVDIRTSEMRTQWSGELLDLVASERYNVIIRAIDANGRMSVRQGVGQQQEALPQAHVEHRARPVRPRRDLRPGRAPPRIRRLELIRQDDLRRPRTDSVPGRPRLRGLVRVGDQLSAVPTRSTSGCTRGRIGWLSIT